MISVKDLLLVPAQFFTDLRGKPESLKFPALIILILGIISGGLAYLVTLKTIEMMPEVGSLSSIIAGGAFVSAIVMEYIYWIIWVVVFYIIARVLKAKPGFKKLAEFTAYGFVPQIFSSIISLIVVSVSLPGITLPVTSNYDEIVSATKELSTTAPMLAVTVISVIFLIWSANIWIFGVKEASGLDLKKSVVCVAVPVVISLLITASSLFM